MIAPQLALPLFVLFVLLVAAVLWPRHGVLPRIARRLLRTDTVLADDALKHLLHQPGASTADLARWLEVDPVRADAVLAHLLGERLVTGDAGGWQLSGSGAARAGHLVRAHRLWERYLADRTGVSVERWHEEAERQEHRLSPVDADRLASRMGRPLVDPHGDPIPGLGGEVPPVEGVPLGDLPDGAHAEVVHLEDEPPEPFRHLVAAGLAPGEHVTVTGRDGDRVRVSWGARSAVLGPGEVAAVTVRAVPAAAAPRGEMLTSLGPGESARVVGLSPSLHGPQRRRLMDLGFVPGTVVAAELHSALGDPVAYRVRGALIALRLEQARSVLVEPAR